MHSHLLPGVDDGVQSADDMQAALNAMQEAGVERVFLTPHVMADLPDNRRSYLQDRFACMKQFAPEGIELRLAAPEFPRIVFHGLRHSSAPYQLMISGGDVKTTGHASADMLVNTYAHIQQSSRVELGKKFESGFYAKPDTPSPQAVPAAGEPTISMTALLELLKDADPEMKAKLRLALLT